LFNPNIFKRANKGIRDYIPKICQVTTKGRITPHSPFLVEPNQCGSGRGPFLHELKTKDTVFYGVYPKSWFSHHLGCIAEDVSPFPLFKWNVPSFLSTKKINIATKNRQKKKQSRLKHIIIPQSQSWKHISAKKTPLILIIGI